MLNYMLHTRNYKTYYFCNHFSFTKYDTNAYVNYIMLTIFNTYHMSTGLPHVVYILYCDLIIIQ